VTGNPEVAASVHGISAQEVVITKCRKPISLAVDKTNGSLPY
jgi:hypothetical protein